MSDISSTERRYPHHELTRRIIASAFAVHRDFGFGFLESVYRKALLAELHHRGIAAATECAYELAHRGTHVGSYRADLVVDLKVIVEVKAGLLLDPAAVAQLLNYLKASKTEVGLVLNFGLSVDVKRLVLSEAIKGIIVQPKERHAPG